MKLVLNWSCDGCKKTKPQTIEYDWKKGLGDTWHPSWLRGFMSQVLCSDCYKKAWDADSKAHPGQVWTA